MRGLNIDLGLSSKAILTQAQQENPTPSNATIVINETSGADQAAPEGIWFDTAVAGFDVAGPAAGKTYDPSLHKIHYVWSFSDPGTYATPSNLVAGHNDKNVAYGPRVSHVFDTPGLYTVTVTATDRSGNSATDTLEVTVRDPNFIFVGAKTIVVAQDGNFSGAPASTIHHTSLDAALAEYQAMSGSGRLLLKRGEVYNVASEIVIGGTYPNFHLGAWGNGAKPVLNSIAGGNSTIWLKRKFTGADFVIRDIRFEGGWDSTTESGLRAQRALYLDAATQVTVHNCEFDGLDLGIYIVPRATYVILNENMITNWAGGCGVFGGAAQNSTVGMTGMEIAQHVDAWAGSKGKGVPGNHHGPLRHSFKNFYMGCCDLFSKSGWSTNQGVVFADQPCIRHNTLCVPDVYAYYDRISCEGGLRVFNMVDAEFVSDDTVSNVILDGMYLLGTAATDTFLRINYAGTTVRNVVMVKPDTPQLVNGIADFIQLFNDGNNADNVAGELDIYNVSFVNLLSGANDRGKPFAVLNPEASAEFPNHKLHNILTYAPNLPSPVLGDGPLSTVEMFTPRYKGFVWHGAPVLDTSYATPAASALQFQPATNSPATGSATDSEVAATDFYGANRTAPSRGAIEGG